MTLIDPRHGVAVALQARLAAARARGRAASPAAASRAGTAASAGQVLAERIRAIPADDPQRRPRAVRLFLESELLREFGGDLLNDPQFATMVDAVHRQLCEDPQLARAAEALADVLLAGEPG
jgi:hypothetical protein